MSKINVTMNLVDHMSSSLNRINTTARNTTKGFESFSGKIVTFNAAMQAFNMVSGVISKGVGSLSAMADEYQHTIEMETRLQTVMQARMGATDEMMSSMKNVLQEQEALTGFSYDMLTNGAQELATYIKDAKTLEGLMPVLANMAKQAGVNTEEGMMSYATMLGKVMGGDMGGMSKRGYVFSDEEKALFKTMDEQERLDFLTKTVTESIGQQATALNNLNPQSLSSLNVQMKAVRREIGAAIKPLMDMYSMITTEWKVAFYNQILNALNLIKNNSNKVVIAITGITVALVALGIQYVVTQRKAIASIIAQAVAWLMVNAQLIAISAAIVGVVALITLILMNSATVFPAVGGFIGGLVGAFKELGANIKYIVKVLIEVVVNAFFTMKDKITDVYLTIFITLISGVEKVAGAMDKVFGTSFAANVNSIKESMEAIRAEAPDKFTLDWTDDRKGFGNAWKEGVESGRNIGAAASDKLQSGISALTEKFAGTNDTIKDTFKLDGSGNLMTAEQNDIDLSSDSKKLLLERATQLYKIQYSQVTPQVVVQTMNVDETVPKQRVIGWMADSVNEAMNSSTY